MSINHQNVNSLRHTGNRKCREQCRRKIGSICVKYPKRCDQFALYYGHHFPCNLLSTKLLSRRFCCINFMSCCSVVYANSVHAVVIPSVWVPVTFAAMPKRSKNNPAFCLWWQHQCSFMHAKIITNSSSHNKSQTNPTVSLASHFKKPWIKDGTGRRRCRFNYC